MLFDTHAHFDDKKFDIDRNQIINCLKENDISFLINVGTNIETSNMSVSLAEEFDFIYATIGIHPHYVDKCDFNTINNIINLCKNKKVVAIGEVGLDYYYDTVPKDIQKIWFIKQINLAKDLNFPIIVHNRDAHEDTINIIKYENAKKVGGILHCFSGSIEMAKIILENNFYISIAGPVTFKNANKLVEVVKYVPLDRLLIETDCPYLTPEPFRGKRNDSSKIKYIAQKIAEIKGMTFEEIANITLNNAKNIFKLN